MKKRYLVLTFLFIIGVPQLFFPIVCRSALPDNIEAFINLKLIEHRQKIESWEFDAKVLVGLTIAIGIFGIAGGALQACKGKQATCKFITIILGVLISLFTLIINNYYFGDHREYRKKIIEAQEIINSIELYKTSPINPNNPADLSEVVATLQKYLKKLSEVERSLVAEIKFEKPLFPVAFAETAHEKRPTWVVNPPNGQGDGGIAGFVGLGEQGSLRKAETIAVENARQQAFQYFKNKKDFRFLHTSASLQRALKEAADIKGRFYEFKQGEQIYVYYVLIEIDANFLRDSALLYDLYRDVPGTLSQPTEDANPQNGPSCASWGIDPTTGEPMCLRWE